MSGSPMTILFFLLFAYASGCEDFWIPVRDSCYRTSPHAMNWNAAEQYCAELGGYLIEIEDAEEQASLETFLNDLPHYWIGLSDEAKEGTFVWQHSFEEAVYTNWANGQPDNGGGDENCGEVHFFWDELQHSWNDEQCYMDGGVYALCEKKNVPCDAEELN